MTDKIAEALGLESNILDTAPVETEKLSFGPDDIQKDYEDARQTAYDLIAKGNHTLDIAIKSLLDNTTVGRLEVIATLMKTIMEANVSRLDIQEKFMKLRPENPTGSQSLGSEPEQPRLIYRKATDLLDDAYEDNA